MDSVFRRFELAAERHAGRYAVESRPRYRTRQWTYAQLDAAVRTLGGRLAAAGLRDGDRVLLHCASSPEWVAAFYAVLGSRAVVVPLNPRSTGDQIDRIVAAAAPAAMLGSIRLPRVAAAVPCIEIERALHAGAEERPWRARHGDPDELVEIVYTSGTTGDPKGVMLSNANLMANVAMVSDIVPLTPGDRVLSIAPLHHMYGQMTAMLYPLSRGASVHYLGTPSARLILDALRCAPITHLVAVPEFLTTLMNRLEQRIGPREPPTGALRNRYVRARISRTLRTIVCGGAPLDPEVERKWRALGLEVLQGYGLTEASPVVTSNTARRHRLGSVGQPCAGVRVRIAPDEEILIRGPNVSAGYFGDPRRTAAAFDDGWFKTGDGGALDADGFLFVRGRKRYVIVRASGENVYPEDIEAELNKIPGVADSAVFGLDRHGRTLVHAVLICTGDARAAIEAANRCLAPHQHIESWSVWPEVDFPRSATRKPRKELIMSWARGENQAPATTGAVTPLVRLLARITDRDPATIHPGTLLVSDLGCDSLMRIELVTGIEEEFGLGIEERDITVETTVAELESRLATHGARAPATLRFPRWSLSPWAQALRPLVRGALLTSWLRFLARLRVSGIEHLAGLEGPVIFMANHRSFLDSPAVIMALPHRFRRRLAIAAATEVLYGEYRGFAPFADLAFNSYPLPTGATENIRPGFDYTGRLLDHAWNVLIYPEGQMNCGAAALLPLKDGAGLLAVEMQVPIVPVGIRGTDAILPAGSVRPRRPGVVDVRFGEALRVDADTDIGAATRAVAGALAVLLQR
jgi:long-chain acyl-CoA synthetase